MIAGRLSEIYPISKPWTKTPTGWEQSKLPSTVVLQQAFVDHPQRVRNTVSSWLEDSDQGGHEWIRRQALEIVSRPAVGTATFRVQDTIKAKDQQESKIGEAIMVIWKHFGEQEIVDDCMNIAQIMLEVIFLIDFQVDDAPSRVSQCYKRDTLLELVLVAILHFGAANKAGYRIEGINEDTLVRMIVPPSCRIFCKDNLADIAIETRDSKFSTASAALSSGLLLPNYGKCARPS